MNFLHEKLKITNLLLMATSSSQSFAQSNEPLRTNFKYFKIEPYKMSYQDENNFLSFFAKNGNHRK